MKTSLQNSALAFVLAAAIPVLALAGIEPCDESTAWMATEGALSLFCLPDGSGSVFAEAYVKNGSGGYTIGADATITLSMLDCASQPVVGYPAEDIWLHWVDESNLFLCVGGTNPDSGTAADGTTTWTAALKRGGYSESLCQVVINGDALTTSAGLTLSINSADINADGIVNLADVGTFAADFANPWTNYRSDFANDGVLNVADVGKLALGVGASCSR